MSLRLLLIKNLNIDGGETGIRTQVRVSPKHAFQACAFSHSAISPARFVSLNLTQSAPFALRLGLTVQHPTLLA